MNGPALVIGFSFLALTLAGTIMGNKQPDELTAMEQEYCEMVDIWLADPRPENQRDGWPDFNNNYGALCAGRE